MATKLCRRKDRLTVRNRKSYTDYFMCGLCGRLAPAEAFVLVQLRLLDGQGYEQSNTRLCHRCRNENRGGFRLVRRHS